MNDQFDSAPLVSAKPISGGSHTGSSEPCSLVNTQLPLSAPQLVVQPNNTNFFTPMLPLGSASTGVLQQLPSTSQSHQLPIDSSSQLHAIQPAQPLASSHAQHLDTANEQQQQQQLQQQQQPFTVFQPPTGSAESTMLSFLISRFHQFGDALLKRQESRKF